MLLFEDLLGEDELEEAGQHLLRVRVRVRVGVRVRVRDPYLVHGVRG